MASREDIFNFSAGPAHLPDEVLQQAQEELLNWRGTGRSIMEISHRSDEFIAVADDAKRRLRSLLSIPDDYKIIYLQGGGRLQFASIPMNLLGDSANCQYLISGHWGRLAAAEAARFGDVKQTRLWQDNPTELSQWQNNNWPIDNNAAYLHLTSNETVDGIQLPDMKIGGAKRVVADMSSDLLTREIDVKNYDIIYACAQKNIGPAGITFLIINPKCLNKTSSPIPSYLDYATQIESDSMANTPPTFSVYMCGLMFSWLDKQGGVAKIAARNKKRAAAIYEIIDNKSDIYINNIPQQFRSNTNITFQLSSKELEDKFLRQAEQKGLLALRGHSLVGGIRISLYNSQPDAAIDCLVGFMHQYNQ